MKTQFYQLIVLFTATATFAQAPALKTTEEPSPFEWGGDIRLRTIYVDNIPNPVGGTGAASSYQRYRTRVWGEYHPSETLFLRGRLVNEFRTVQTPNNRNAWSAFDETVVDNLFLEWRSDLFDIRVGRQELIYGTGKILFDGTPLDGSRTIYFDAIKATYKGIPETTVDLLALYTHYRNPLVLHSQDRGLVGMTPAYDGAEAGGGIYIKNNTFEDFPWEAYWIIKSKEEGLDDTINTVGMRLLPKLFDAFTTSLETAYQSTTDTSEYMIDAQGNWNLPGLEDQKAYIGLGWYHLSNEWNPVFSRCSQYSDLFVSTFTPANGGIGRWSNVSMPHVDFSITPCTRYSSDLSLAYLFAPSSNGPGDGHNRGLLFFWKNSFTLSEKILSERDKLTGSLLLEISHLGDYYTSDQRDKTAAYIQAELNYAF